MAQFNAYPALQIRQPVEYAAMGVNNTLANLEVEKFRRGREMEGVAGQAFGGDMNALGKYAAYDPEKAGNLLKVYQAASGGGEAFEGNSMDAQAANIQYRRYLKAGLSPEEAKIKAINDIRTTRQSMYVDASGRLVPQTGQPLPDVGGNPLQRMSGPGMSPLPGLAGGEFTQGGEGTLDDVLNAESGEDQYEIDAAALDKASPEDIKMTKRVSELAQGVLDSDNPEEAYINALDTAQEEGLPIDNMPPLYTPQAKKTIKQFADVGKKVDEYYSKSPKTLQATAEARAAREVDRESKTVEAYDPEKKAVVFTTQAEAEELGLQPKDAAPEMLSGESAKSISLANQGIRNYERIWGKDGEPGLLFNKDGSVKRSLLAELTDVPLAGRITLSDDARIAWTYAYSMADAILRLKTGAAAPEQEVRANAKAYLPSILDGKRAAIAKGQEPLDFFTDVKQLLEYKRAVPEDEKKTSNGLPNDPRVQKAREAGYTDEEIRQYLKGRQ